MQCKRLKLKCDRRTPCSSCIKREVVQRCAYSAAASEKVSVRNRIPHSISNPLAETYNPSTIKRSDNEIYSWRYAISSASKPLKPK